MKLTIISTDTINGIRANKETNLEDVTKTELEARRKDLLAELERNHPEMSSAEKKFELLVCFQYRDQHLGTPDPRFMPKPLCECGLTARSNNEGNIYCDCGNEWYNEHYNLSKYLKLKAK